MKTKYTATLFDVHTLSGHDGPGLRTTFFFQGCPLSCVWCHNPESQSMKQNLWWYRQSCIHCHACINACEQNALAEVESTIKWSTDSCVRSFACIQACPTGALRLIGKHYTIDELYAIVQRDAPFITASNGGVTVSGGEPLLQASVVGKLFSFCKDHGIHTALDTSGQVPFASMQEVLPLTDLVLYDLKLIDSEQHERWTGSPNGLILDNFKKLVQEKAKAKYNYDIWVRTPLIPGATAYEQNIKGIGQFLVKNGVDYIQRWELLAFNNLAVEKYDRLGLPWMFKGAPLMQSSLLEALKVIAEKNLGIANKVTVSGLTAK